MNQSEGSGVGSVRLVTNQEKDIVIIMVRCGWYYRVSAGLIYAGLERDHTKGFTAMRRKAVDASYLEVSRLEKRVTKLTHLLSDPVLQQDQGGVVGYFRTFSGVPNQKRLVEQTVVDWEDDAKVGQCPFCQQDFSNYTFRRHHCRVCGRVVCADPLTGCSSEVALDVAARQLPLITGFSIITDGILEKNLAQISVNVRMCKDCKHTLFRKSDFAREVGTETADQRAYQNLKQFERGIRMMLPRFQKLIAALQYVKLSIWYHENTI